jgi:hypothetical protein
MAGSRCGGGFASVLVVGTHRWEILSPVANTAWGETYGLAQSGQSLTKISNRFWGAAGASAGT